MSKNIYNRSKKYCSAILRLRSAHNDILNNNDDTWYISNKKYAINKNYMAYRSNLYKRYTTVISCNHVSKMFNSNENHVLRITDDSYKNKLCITINEYHEDFDFQLSTLFNDEELFEYYLFCMLKQNGIQYTIRSDIHINTINTLIKKCKEIKLSIERAKYIDEQRKLFQGI